MISIAIVGQGYVGLPLAVKSAESNFKVWGIESKESKLMLLEKGKSYIEGVSEKAIQYLLANGNYNPTSSYKKISECKIVVICVPTPLDMFGKPDTSLVEMAAKQVSPYLSKNTLVILESTVEPGFTRNKFVSYILEFNDLDVQDLAFAFSPERIDPNNKVWTIENTPKIVAGLNHDASIQARDFYARFIQKIYIAESIEVAEMAKLLENSFRLINISFINEFAKICETLEIDVLDVIQAASTKPYGFMPFYPGLGVGGHCIPVDPVYLATAAKNLGLNTDMIDQAILINNDIPKYFVTRAERLLKTLKNKRILVIGVAYKSNISDVRDTPARQLIVELESKGAIVSWHDDLVQEWNSTKSVKISKNFDLAILANPHDGMDLSSLSDMPVLDSRNYL